MLILRGNGEIEKGISEHEIHSNTDCNDCGLACDSCKKGDKLVYKCIFILTKREFDKIIFIDIKSVTLNQINLFDVFEIDGAKYKVADRKDSFGDINVFVLALTQ
jgi:hypothetical protein